MLMSFAAFECIFALFEIYDGEKKAPITVLSPLVVVLAMVNPQFSVFLYHSKSVSSLNVACRALLWKNIKGCFAESKSRLFSN